MAKRIVNQLIILPLVGFQLLLIFPMSLPELAACLMVLAAAGISHHDFGDYHNACSGGYWDAAPHPRTKVCCSNA